MKNKREFNLMTLKRFLSKNKFSITSCLILLLVGAIILPKAFAQPIKSVEIISDSVSFEEKDPGAWKVDKSAKWVGKGEAEITFDVDSIMKTNNKYTDVLFVLDVSGSMDGDKLNRVKADSIELIESLLSNGENKAGLITFDSTSNIVLDFTKDEELLKEKINSLTTTGCTNYYQALVNVDEVLKNYKKEKDRECVILFLTDGYPNEDTPNEETQYSYLRQQYPFVTINGIQYEMGTYVLEPVKKVSDNQFIADMDTLNNVLFDASVTPITYDKFSITDYIDTNYFNVEDENNIKVSQGTINLDKVNQKVTWTINEFKSGFKAKMTIKVKLKDEFINKGGFYPTNIKEEIKSKLEDIEENVESDKTPVLSDNYKVIYDGNAPTGCNIEGVPETRNHSVFDAVGISDASLKCEGYQFRGWEIVTDSARWINDDYFTMPEENVVIRAKWGKLSIDKAMDGEVHEYIPATLERYTSGSTYGLHKYKSSITDIVFQDTMSKIGGAIDVLDISAENNNGILAYIVPNEDDSTKYTAYIQGDGSVIANIDSSYLFDNFTNLKSIQNLEYLDTSNVINMSSMFSGCNSLTSLNLSSFDTSSVTGMSLMFFGCGGLTNLVVSGFDTSKVTMMGAMFVNCSSLTSLNLSNFNTSKVTIMSNMFGNCSNLTNLDLSRFDTSSVTGMSSIFSGCSSLTSLNLSNFDTSNVTTMSNMFVNCSNLTNLDLSRFDTSNVWDMSGMFRFCGSLTSLDLSNFDTSNVINMNYMLDRCSSLTNIDLSNFDTSSVISMYSMFSGCSSLTILDLSSFDTSRVALMDSMFYGCGALTSLDLSNFNTSSLTNMQSMFKECSSLTNIDLSNFDTSSVISMYSMFSGCSSLTILDLSSFDTSKVTDMKAMFYKCDSLINLDLSNFNTFNVTAMGSSSYSGGMFEECSNLTSLNLSSFDTSNVTGMSSMFKGCRSLTSLNLSSFDTSKVISMESMFNGCRSLTSLDLSSFDTSQVSSMSYMFDGCRSLTSLDLSGFDTSQVSSMSYMFRGCSNLSAELTLANKIFFSYSYDKMFSNAATAEGAQITVNYTESVADVIDSYINTKSSNSNVVKGELV